MYNVYNINGRLSLHQARILLCTSPPSPTSIICRPLLNPLQGLDIARVLVLHSEARTQLLAAIDVVGIALAVRRTI